MSSISESKYQNRGPLIAVIKIELDSQNIDRIFLHAKDNDEELADQFVEKHGLNPMLKKHIFQRIQMSRLAVDKNKVEQNYDEENDQEFHQNDFFTTPVPKRDYRREQSSQKKLINPLPIKEKLKQKKIEPYITYDDSQVGANDTFEVKYHGQSSYNNSKPFENKNNERKLYENDSYASKQQTNRVINEVSTYARDKYKNLYDVSGLKLKSSHPSVSNDISVEASRKDQKQEYTSSESSQGLFEKELSNEKVFQNASKDFIHESRIPEFREVAEPYQHQTFNHVKLESKPKTWKQNESINGLVKHSDYSQNKPFGEIQKQNQTKFSSIEKSSESDFMDLNYISFNKPYNEVPSEIQHRNSVKFPGQSMQSYEQQLFGHSNETNSKRVGSIRSNAKTFNEAENSVKSNNEIPYSNHQSTPYSDLETTTKFSQEKLFTNIKDIHNTRELQQNRQINTDTTRPAVKFYNKEEMKSLKQSTLSKSMSRAQLSRINAEVTSRLYNEAEIKKKYIQTLKARAKNLKEEELEDIEELREKPEINMLSKLLAENRIKENKKIQDYLMDQGKILELKRQQMASRQAKKQLEQCSFRPQINQQSYRLSVLQRSRSKSRISNHSEIKCSKRTYNNESTFHPEINKLSNQIAKGKGNFNERQHAFLQEKNSNLFKKQQQQRMKQKTDQVSGQRLFQPQLNQRTLKLAKQSVQKNRQNKPIHSYLYELSKVSRVQQKLDPRPQINPQSEKLIQQLQEKRLNWLFLQLDNDEDGIISSKRICIDQIPTQILQIIAPVLYEMEQLNTELNIQDFKSAIKNLNKGLDPYQKSILYNYSHSVKMIRT